jgi:hypothetical protein
MAPLAGAGAGAAAGGLVGALIGMGMPELEAQRYEGKIRNGNILLSVHAEDSEELSGKGHSEERRCRRYLLYRRICSSQ